MFDMSGDGAALAGLNLGLTLVKRLIELQDGAIRAESDGIGKGATFEIRFSLAPQDVELPSLDPFASQDPDQTADPYCSEPTSRVPVLEPATELGTEV
jgi:hypothetical protein